MIELTLEQKLINAKLGLDKVLRKAYKTGMKKQEGMIKIYKDRIKELEQELEKQIEGDVK
tara:strand:- start:129 stop:308 length:180 start_codon:yes stop_codon:yes gene_type:complete